MFIHFCCLCPLGLATKPNFNISKVVYVYCVAAIRCLRYYVKLIWHCRLTDMGPPWAGRVEYEVKRSVKSLHTSQVVRQSVAYHGFCSMKQQRVFHLSSPLGGMPVYHRVTPSIKFAGTHTVYIHPCKERHCESKASCQRTHHNDQYLKPDHSIRGLAH